MQIFIQISRSNDKPKHNLNKRDKEYIYQELVFLFRTTWFKPIDLHK